MKKLIVLVLVGLLAGLTVTTVHAGKPGATDIETYRGQVSVNQPATVYFNTFPNENGVILTFQARNGGDRTLNVYDSANNLVATIGIPAEASSPWGTYISVNPSSSYKVVITVSEGQTKYTLWVNHCPNGQCF